MTDQQCLIPEHGAGCQCGDFGTPMDATPMNLAKEHPIMLHVKGEERSFHCPCGCNVFHHPQGDKSIIKCNACGYEYIEGRDFDR